MDDVLHILLTFSVGKETTVKSNEMLYPAFQKRLSLGIAKIAIAKNRNNQGPDTINNQITHGIGQARTLAGFQVLSALF